MPFCTKFALKKGKCMPFNKGDIITGVATKHPIIYLEDIDNITFKACIITHADDEQYPDNIRMTEYHFKERDEDGNRYEISYDETFFVSKCLIKKNEWGPYEKKGELTLGGIEFVERMIENERAIYWEYYIG